jgi:hypothetical protein
MKCRLTDSHSEPSPAPFLYLPNEPADSQYGIFGGYSKDRKCSGTSGILVLSFAKFALKTDCGTCIGHRTIVDWDDVVEPLPIGAAAVVFR